MIENPQHFNLITNFEEITSRPNFVEKVTIARGEDVQNTISDLVGFYVLRDFVSCGISSCGKKHQKGYIAALHDGNEIIIGHKCGKKHFGVSFDEKAKQFKHLRDNANQYLQIKAMYEKLPQLKESLERILNQSGKMTFLQIKMAVKSFKEDAFDYWMRRRIGQEVTSNGSIFICGLPFQPLILLSQSCWVLLEHMVLKLTRALNNLLGGRLQPTTFFIMRLDC